MRRVFSYLTLIAVIIAVTSISAHAGQGVVSTMKNVNAVSEAGGIYLAPARGYAVQRFAGDEAQPQLFEIIRPHGEKITIGRLHTSCSCVRLEAHKTTFEQGEHAVLTLRNVRATPVNGQNYAIYVQITSPVRTTLRIDTYFQSDRFRQAPTTSEPQVAAGQVVTTTGYSSYRY